MARSRKDARYLNVYIRRDIADRLDAYCAATGRTKTVFTEWALEKMLDEKEPELLDHLDQPVPIVEGICVNPEYEEY